MRSRVRRYGEKAAKDPDLEPKHFHKPVWLLGSHKGGCRGIWASDEGASEPCATGQRDVSPELLTEFHQARGTESLTERRSHQADPTLPKVPGDGPAREVYAGKQGQSQSARRVEGSSGSPQGLRLRLQGLGLDCFLGFEVLGAHWGLRPCPAMYRRSHGVFGNT